MNLGPGIVQSLCSQSITDSTATRLCITFTEAGGPSSVSGCRLVRLQVGPRTWILSKIHIRSGRNTASKQDRVSRIEGLAGRRWGSSAVPCLRRLERSGPSRCRTDRRCTDINEDRGLVVSIVSYLPVIKDGQGRSSEDFGSLHSCSSCAH